MQSPIVVLYRLWYLSANQFNPGGVWGGAES